MTSEPSRPAGAVPSELGVMLRGYQDEADRDAVRKAYYESAQGDPNTFPVRFSVLLAAHCLALEQSPERLKQKLDAWLKGFVPLLESYQGALKHTAEALERHHASTDNQLSSLQQIAERMESAAGRMESAASQAHSKVDEIHSISSNLAILYLALAVATGFVAAFAFLHWYWGIQ